MKNNIGLPGRTGTGNGVLEIGVDRAELMAMLRRAAPEEMNALDEVATFQRKLLAMMMDARAEREGRYQ